MAEAAFNPTPGERLGVDQDSYEAKGNTWIRWCRHSTNKANSHISGKTTRGSTSSYRAILLTSNPLLFGSMYIWTLLNQLNKSCNYNAENSMSAQFSCIIGTQVKGSALLEIQVGIRIDTYI